MLPLRWGSCQKFEAIDAPSALAMIGQRIDGKIVTAVRLDDGPTYADCTLIGYGPAASDCDLYGRANTRTRFRSNQPASPA